MRTSISIGIAQRRKIGVTELFMVRCFKNEKSRLRQFSATKNQISVDSKFVSWLIGWLLCCSGQKHYSLSQFEYRMKLASYLLHRRNKMQRFRRKFIYFSNNCSVNFFHLKSSWPLRFETFSKHGFQFQAIVIGTYRSISCNLWFNNLRKGVCAKIAIQYSN